MGRENSREGEKIDVDNGMGRRQSIIEQREVGGKGMKN